MGEPQQKGRFSFANNSGAQPASGLDSISFPHLLHPNFLMANTSGVDIKKIFS